MFEQTFYGIPIIAIIAVAIIALALIGFFFYIASVKKRVAAYSQDFAAAIDEFKSTCNPSHPMSNTEWDSFADSHSLDFEHAEKSSTSKFIAFIVKDLANAYALIDIRNNHRTYMIDAQRKHDKIVFFEHTFQQALSAKANVFDLKHYIAKSESENLFASVSEILTAANFCIENNLLEYLTHANDCKELSAFFKTLEKKRENHNNIFVMGELERCSNYFDNILSYPLDPQQRFAIVNGEDNCLVVSSAGSGKTSTIQGKVRYLVDERHVDPDDILLITYTRKAAEELRNRIGFGALRCVTFHKLAYEIIAEVDKAPTISSADLTLNLFYNLLKQKNFIEAVTYYLVNLLSRMKDPDKYVSEREYYADRRKYGIQSLFPDMDGNRIFTRSEEERKICHFLSMHGISFRYEERYEYTTANNTYRQYKPDFSIYFTRPDGTTKRIYLEHFGINSRGQVPRWFGQSKGISWEDANSRYNQDIIWKRNLHRQKRTTLIETTSAMFADGSWERQLASQLRANGVPVVLKPVEQIYQEIVQRDKHKEKTVLDLIVSFITLLKANCKSIDEIAAEARKTNDSRNLFIIEKMIKPFYVAYQALLKEKDEIDFTDAILLATAFCHTNSYKKRYRYIIIDEFQDISFDRYKLLMAIRSQSPLGKIFAVGDDWQSIYRFSGSDMGLFSDFPKHFGFTTQCKIETTYRFAQPAIDISSAFIQKNKSQVKKNVKSKQKDKQTTISFEGYSEDYELADAIANKIRSIPANNTIYILSRYAFDFAIFKDKYKYRENERNIEITIDNRKVRCLTVHQAKGLEADYIFLLKCNSDIYGFPAMISDDPVLEYLLSQHEDSIEFAEERRVFYVAITRAKINTTIFYRRENPSIFVDEIVKELDDDHLKKCPCCGYGHLQIIRQGWAQSGSYYVSIGCTNSLAGCDYFRTEFYNNGQPDDITIKRLIYPEWRFQIQRVDGQFRTVIIDEKPQPNPGGVVVTTRFR